MAGPLNALPRLRDDLKLLRAGPSYSGAPAWVIHDPAGNKFFRLTFESFQLVSLWNRAGTPDALALAVTQRFGRVIDGTEIEAVLTVLKGGNLLEPAPDGWQALHKASLKRHGLIMSSVHNYLFFKIPLVRPQRFLDAAWPFVRFMFTRGFLLFAALAGLIGLYFVSRQWDAFVNSFPFFFSFEGLIASFASVIIVKSLHELGHGFMARRFGCHVPTMGLAFMVMVPMLYTDVSDAWKLKSRRERILIDSAGILVELALAAFCLLLWAFLPDGPLRSLVFTTATVSLIMSLLMNLNPLMRFDGYYILSDLMGVPNLQVRAFNHMSWRLRRLLFGLHEEPPERFPPRVDHVLTAYSIATAIYRIFLYIGIALLVYHFFIKVVGIVLFLVEIIFFILRPVWLELKTWWTMRKHILARPRTYVTAALASAAAIAAFLPLSGHVIAPAMYEPSAFARLYPPAEGAVVSIAVTEGQMVRSGDLIAVLDAPALAAEIKVAQSELALRETRLARGGADAEDLGQRMTLERERASFTAKIEGLKRLQKKLEIRAPFDGQVTSLNPKLYTGRWIAPGEDIALITGAGGAVSRGYVEADEMPRIAPGATARFIPDDLTEADKALTLADVAIAGAAAIEIAALSSDHGGRIATQRDPQDRLVPVKAQYAVLAKAADGTARPDRMIRGVLHIEARPESLAARAWRQILKVAVRESGA